ncbi:hypothetical protein AcW1_004235 [Taiwanofungus camphoratus]|nr:hypothetical protein AcW1_004235 [Antrodia cinnamomea]
MHGLTFNIQPLESVLIHTHTMELELPLRASQMSLIPQPKHANRSSLRVAMKIDVKSFNAATSYLRQLGREMLNTTTTWTRQDPKLQKAVIERATVEYPLFGNYVKSWPVKLYYIQFLKRSAFNRYKLRASSKATTHTSSCLSGPVPIMHPHMPQQASQAQVTMHENPHQDTAVSHYLLTQSMAVCLNNHITGQSKSRANSHDAVPKSTPVTPRDLRPRAVASSSSLATQTALTVTTPTPHQTGDDFTAFMRSLEPDLAHLAPAFAYAGISSESRFRAMAAWPEAERATLLRQDMMLTPFDYHSARVAVANLLQGAGSTV